MKGWGTMLLPESLWGKRYFNKDRNVEVQKADCRSERMRKQGNRSSKGYVYYGKGSGGEPRRELEEKNGNIKSLCGTYGDENNTGTGGRAKRAGGEGATGASRGQEKEGIGPVRKGTRGNPTIISSRHCGR